MIHGGPRGTTTARRASFHIMSTEAGSKLQCKLDRGPWRACGSRKTLRALKAGWHTFLARATDAAGNRDGTPAKRRWRIR
jgi:large repetitive protein